MIDDFTYLGQVVQAHVVGHFRVFVCCRETNHAIAHENGWLIACGFASVDDALYVADAVSLYSTQEGHEFKPNPQEGPSKDLTWSMVKLRKDPAPTPFYVHDALEELYSSAWTAEAKERMGRAINEAAEIMRSVKFPAIKTEMSLDHSWRRTPVQPHARPAFLYSGAYEASAKLAPTPSPTPCNGSSTTAPLGDLVTWARNFRFHRRRLSDDWKTRAQKPTEADWDLLHDIMRDFGLSPL